MGKLDPTVGLILVELAKGLLQMFFAILSKAGTTEEEIEAIYVSEKAAFQLNKPELLPDIPLPTPTPILTPPKEKEDA